MFRGHYLFGEKCLRNSEDHAQMKINASFSFLLHISAPSEPVLRESHESEHQREVLSLVHLFLHLPNDARVDATHIILHSECNNSDERAEHATYEMLTCINIG